MNTIYSYIATFWNKSRPLFTRGAVVYLTLILIHFAAANLYPRMCTPLTFIGFLMSPFMVVAPHCEGLRWLISFTGTQIRNMWLWIGGYLLFYVNSAVSDNNLVHDPPRERVDKTPVSLHTRSHSRMSVNTEIDESE